MSSVNSLLNSGSASTTGSSVANKTLTSISNKLTELENDTTHSEEYKEEKVSKLNSLVGVVSSSSANIENASNLINGMLGKNTDISDFSAFFGNSLSSVRTLVKASTVAQNEARTLAAEIRLDKIRGNDTSDKEETLSNLTENTAILNKTLGSRIDSILADENTDSDTRSVIDKIKDELAENQKKLDVEFGRTEEDKEEDGVTTKSELSEESVSSTTSGTKPSVIDQIKSSLAENQKKLDEEFGRA